MNEYRIVDKQNNTYFIIINSIFDSSIIMKKAMASLSQESRDKVKVVFDTLLNCINKDDYRRFISFTLEKGNVLYQSKKFETELDKLVIEKLDDYFKTIDKRLIEYSLLDAESKHYYNASKE